MNLHLRIVKYFIIYIDVDDETNLLIQGNCQPFFDITIHSASSESWIHVSVMTSNMVRSLERFRALRTLIELFLRHEL